MQTGVKYQTVYTQTRKTERIRKNGFESPTEYRKHLARKNGFKSHNEYLKYLARQRSEKKENIEFGNLVRTRLRDLDRNQSWLAEQLGVSDAVVSFYANGKSRPKGENLNRLLLTLEIQNIPKGLENLV